MGARNALVAVMGMVVSMISIATSHADPAPPSIDVAIHQAAAANKPLVVEFGTSWCGPCLVFEQETLPLPAVQAVLGAVVFVQYDAEAAPGQAAAARYRIAGYPTFLVLDRTGAVRARRAGGLAEQSFIDLVRGASLQVADDSDIRRDLAANPNDPEAQLRAAQWFLEHRRPSEALVFFHIAKRLEQASPPAPSPTQARQATDAERAVVKAVAAACAKYSGRSPLAIARLETDAASGRITTAAVIVDDAATAKLRPCLARELGSATLPTVPGHARRALMIDFTNPGN